MKPVTQEEISGCGIASVAVLSGLSYQEAKTVANSRVRSRMHGGVGGGGREAFSYPD